MAPPVAPNFLPYGRQAIDDDDIAAVAAVLRSESLTTGPEVDAFERDLAAKIGASHAVACANGTAALHLAALALGLGPGDSVIVPSITFLATANAARFVGAEVVFADVDPDTGLMGPDDLAAALSRAGGKAKAVFPVHLTGQCVDIDALTPLARRAGLAVVEDACHALGGMMGERMVGADGPSTMAVFSFHPVKTIAMGEGGAITTADSALCRRLRSLRNHGITRDADDFVHREEAFDAQGQANPWYYEMQDIGFNYRASDILCALGRSQLRKLDGFVARRTALAARYDALLSPLSERVRPIPRVPGCRPGLHLYPVLIDFERLGIPRAEVMHRLRARGIGTQVHYIPVHRQPYYRKRQDALDLPGADAYYRRTLSLPLFAAMTDDDVERVVSALAEVLEA